MTSQLQERNGAARVAIFVELGFRTGVQRVWSGKIITEVAGKVWLPVGDVGRIGPIEERADLGARAFSLQLAAFAADHAAEPFDTFRQAVRTVRDLPVIGRGVAIWRREYGVGSGLAVLASPELSLVKRGIMSSIAREETADLIAVTLTCEDRKALDRLPSNARITPADIEARNPGDKIAEFAPGLGAGDGRLVNWRIHQ